MKLRVAQFNVENLFLFLDLYDGQNFQDITEDEWQAMSYATTNNKPLRKTIELGQSIMDLNPDILCVNEVGGPESLSNFAKYFLNDKYEAFVKEGNSDRGIDIGYLVKKELPLKYLHLSHRNRPINFLYPHEIGKTQKKSHFFSRDISELRIFNENPNSPDIIILLVHLKSKLDPQHVDFQGRLRRKAELETLIDVYNEIQKNEFKEDIKIIVAGDFNGRASSLETDEEFGYLHSHSDLVDAFDILGLSNKDTFTQAQIYPNSKKEYNRIDYIFVSKNLEPHIKSGDVYNFKNNLGLPYPKPTNLAEKDLLPSDHYPIFIDIEI